MFCEASAGLWDWIQEATKRGVFNERAYVVCMDRVRYPLRAGIWHFEDRLADVKRAIDERDLPVIMAAPHFAP